MLISPTCGQGGGRGWVCEAPASRMPAPGTPRRGSSHIRPPPPAPHLILNHRHPLVALLPQDVVEKGGLAGSQEAGDLQQGRGAATGWFGRRAWCGQARAAAGRKGWPSLLPLQPAAHQRHRDLLSLWLRHCEPAELEARNCKRASRAWAQQNVPPGRRRRRDPSVGDPLHSASPAQRRPPRTWGVSWGGLALQAGWACAQGPSAGCTPAGGSKVGCQPGHAAYRPRPLIIAAWSSAMLPERSPAAQHRPGPAPAPLSVDYHCPEFAAGPQKRSSELHGC